MVPTAATGAATGASKGPSRLAIALPCTTRSSGWSSGRMVFGANTYRQFVRLLGSSTEGSDVGDPWVTRMRSMPATVVSTTLEGRLDWPNATVVSRDGALLHGRDQALQR